MSVPPRQLPPRPSLEQLRKQAKEHLETLRSSEPAANLASAQHALAREYGFENWPALVHHVESIRPGQRMVRPPELESDEKLTWSAGRGSDVGALFEACAAGNLRAVQALIARDPTLVRAHFEYRKPLYFAVRENQIDVVRFLLERDSNPLDLWVDDDPIEIARDRGYVPLERMLVETLETKFNASEKGEPVALAIRKRDLKKMRALIDAQPALLHQGDKRSNQPIHWATMARQPKAIDELLGRGADINARRMDGARPIHLTNGDYFYRGWRDVSRFWPVTPARVMAHLNARGAVIDLPTACHTGDIDRVRELLRQDPSLANRIGEHEGYYLGAGAPLSNAAAAGRMDVVQLLVDHGADPNLPEEQYAPKGKALYEAVYHGHFEIAKLLLERGAFPNPPVESSGDALWVSRKWRPNKRMEALLLSFGAEPAGTVTRSPGSSDPGDSRSPGSSDPGDSRSPGSLDPGTNWLRISPLHQAARDGNVSRAKALLDADADLNARDDHLRSTPLAWAAKFGHARMVKYLLKRGAPKRLPDDPEWATPRAWALRRGHKKIAEML